MEPPFAHVSGVIESLPGYTGGHVQNPTYEQVCAGGTGHYEAVQITYDPKQVSFEALLDVYWRQTDPTDGGGQFADRGSSTSPRYSIRMKRRSTVRKHRCDASKSFWASRCTQQYCPLRHSIRRRDTTADTTRRTPNTTSDIRSHQGARHSFAACGTEKRRLSHGLRIYSSV